MPLLTLFLVGLVLHTSPAAPAVGVSSRLQEVTFESAALGGPAKYLVALPEGYEAATNPVPVLYLLHGLTGGYRDWSTRTRLFDHLADANLLVVMPDADDSWYVNAGERAGYEDYVALDLVADVERRFRALATREGRAIAGLSMGGYGAIKIAFRYPDKFSVAGSFSGAFEVIRDGRPGRWVRDPKAFRRLFGPPGSPRRIENDVFLLARKADPAMVPYFYLDCGTGDPLLPANRDFVAILRQRKVAYEYHESPGAHRWDYWDRRLPELLRVIEQRLQSAAGQSR